jgi:hypothetical protein
MDELRHQGGAFGIVPKWLIEADISAQAVRLYAHLAQRANNETHRTWPSRKSMADACRCSVSTIDRTLDELVGLGALRVEPRRSDRGDQTSNLYTVILTHEDPLVAGDDTPSSRANRPPSSPMNTYLDQGELDQGELDQDLAPAPRARARDLLWEAVMAACGVDGATLTPSARGAANKALAELRSVDATPAQVHQRAQVHRATWDVRLTPTSLARHWAECERLLANPSPREVRHELEKQQAMERRRQREENP